MAIFFLCSFVLEDRLVKGHLTAIDISDPLTQSVSQQMYSALEVFSGDSIDRLRNRKWFQVRLCNVVLVVVGN